MRFGDAGASFRGHSGKSFEQFKFQLHVQSVIYQNLLNSTGAESDVDANKISKLTYLIA